MGTRGGSLDEQAKGTGTTSPVAGEERADTERAHALLEGAWAEKGGVGSAAAGRGAGRGRRRQLEVMEAELAAGARVAPT
jgi:hypothetical protein